MILDKKVYQKGDVIKGRTDSLCAAGTTDPEHNEAYRRNPSIIKVHEFSNLFSSDGNQHDFAEAEEAEPRSFSTAFD